MNRIHTITSILLFSLFMISCKTDQKKKNVTPTEFMSVITKGYEVNIANKEFSSGALRFMETEEYRNNILSKKTFFDKYEQTKGVEVYEYDGKKYPKESFFYLPDGTQLSRYELTYADGKKTKAMAYEGESDELLRIERYEYSPQGYLLSKAIFDSNDVLQKSFHFDHDTNGNEKKMTVKDGKGEVILYEDYEIVEIDTLGRWLSKWGYVNGKGQPSTFQECSRSDYQ